MRYSHEELVKVVFETAISDEGFLDRLITNPSRMFASVGMWIPENVSTDFDLFFQQEVQPLLMQVRQGEAGFPSLGCASCKVAAWSVAALIVATGAGALAMLTVASPAVLALAGFAGVAPAAALAFIQSLAVAIGGGISAVALKICEWMKVCP